MDRIFTKGFFLALAFLCFILTDTRAQSVILGSIDPGPYGQGSTIGVPFNLNTTAQCASSTNVFNLYLSDAAGNFGSQTLIGSFSGFYGTFVNGVIPNGTPAGSGYRLKIQCSDPAINPVTSTPITISAAGGVAAATASQAINIAFPDVFGTCIGVDNTRFSFVNQSSGAAPATASFYNELDKINEGTISLNGSFTAKAANYTILVKATGGGVIGTKAYWLINNKVNNGLIASGSTSDCLLNGKVVRSYQIDKDSPDGIEKNFPGLIYSVTWGDGTSSNYTLCDIVTADGKVSHTYTKSSCGNVANGEANVFQVNFLPTSPYCAGLVRPLSAYASIVQPPSNKISAPKSGCTDSVMTFINSSIPGQDPNSSSFDCTNINALYTWVVDGVVQKVNATLSEAFDFKFTTNGTHYVGIHLQNSAVTCPVADTVVEVCIQNAPKPSFALPGSTICTSGSVIPVNTSVLDENCNTGTTYNWVVSGPIPVAYLGGTNAASKNPRFDFNASGVYTVRLDITTSSCGLVSSPTDTIAVNLTPTANMAANALVCGNNQTLSFSPTATVTRTTLTGTSRSLPGTYTWTVTGGAYSFVNGTSFHSRYPQILFNDYAVYTITVVHTNNCATVSDSQQLSFQQAPIVSAGPAQTICEGNTATLAGTISGATTGRRWVGGTGTFSLGRNNLNSVYTPSAAERAAGTVTLTLEVNTTLAAPCDVIQSPVIITITKKDDITSAPAADACSRSNFTYTITSSNPVTTYSWTAVNTSGSASGFGATGSGNTINDIINNTGTNDAVVTYTITPTTDGCPGNQFRLVVTVRVIPVITATPFSLFICSVQPAGINLASNIAGTKYTWTSTASPGNAGNTDQLTPVDATNIGDVLTNSTTTGGTVTYVITPFNGTCAGAPVTVAVNIIPLPVTSLPGADEEICFNPTYKLSGNDPAPGTGRWTVTSGQTGISFSNPADPNATVSGLQPGNVYQFTWTISSAPTCVPTSNFVTITVDRETVGGTATGSTAVCANTNSGFINLTGNVGDVLRWEFTVDNGVTWLTLANTTTQVEYTNLTQSTQYRAVVQSGVCSTQTSAIATVTVNPPAITANAGLDAVVCNATSVTLAGNAPSPFVGVWTQTGGPPVTIVDPSNPQTQVTGLSGNNTYSFTWTIKGLPPCGDTFDEVVITNAPDVLASFTADKTVGCGPLTVQFTNTSNFVAGVNFLWDFGDGSTSTLANPQHTFAAGTEKDVLYQVRLSLVDNCVPHPPITLDIITRPAIPVARILPEKLTGCGTLAIRAENVSPGDNDTYEFYLYDGNTLIEYIQKINNDKSAAVFKPLSPPVEKKYTLYMVATDLCGTKSQTNPLIDIVISPATFKPLFFPKNNENSGCVPYTATFENISSGGDQFKYRIYDANNVLVDEIQGAPVEQSYLFSKAGTYFVSIVAKNDCAELEMQDKVRFDIYAIPAPDFRADATAGCKHLLVNFSNLTPANGGTPSTSLSFDWDFGDNSPHFTGFNPQPHLYKANANAYTITLKVTNLATGCTNMITRANFIKVNPAPNVDFTASPGFVTTIPNYRFAFDDETSGNPVSWQWAFGDGSTSSEQNPGHTYADTGTYRVTLRVVNREGCDSLVAHNVQITGTPGQLYLPNAFMPSGSATDLRVFEAKGSGLQTWRLQIFNNWGQLVWETTKLSSRGEPTESWDGTFKGSPAPQGVYVWQASARFINGTDWKGMSYNSSLPKRTGVIHLIR